MAKKTKENKPPRKPFFNFRGWLGWSHIREGASAISTMASSLFVIKEASHIETFEEALARLQLTEADLKKRLKTLQRLFLIFFTASLTLFAYAVYLLLQQAFSASLASFGLTAMLLAQTFRYHFWCFQIKHRKLGCSLKEWFQQGLLGIDPGERAS